MHLCFGMNLVWNYLLNFTSNFCLLLCFLIWVCFVCNHHFRLFCAAPSWLKSLCTFPGLSWISPWTGLRADCTGLVKPDVVMPWLESPCLLHVLLRCARIIILPQVSWASGSMSGTFKSPGTSHGRNSYHLCPFRLSGTLPRGSGICCLGSSRRTKGRDEIFWWGLWQRNKTGIRGSFQ